MKKLLLPLFLLFVVIPDASANISLVNQSGGGSENTDQSTVATSPLSTSTGNFIVVAIGTTAATLDTIASVNDTAGNTYVEGSGCQELYAEDAGVYIYYASNITGNANNVVTVNFNESDTYQTVLQFQYSGVATSNVFVQCAIGGASSSTAVTTFTFTPNSGDLLVAYSRSSGGDTYTPGTGWAQQEYTMFSSDLFEDIEGATNIPQAATMTMGSAQDWAIVAADFTAAPSYATTINNAKINNAILN